MGCWSRGDPALCKAVGYWQAGDLWTSRWRVEYLVTNLVVIDQNAIDRADDDISLVSWFRAPVYRYYVTWRRCSPDSGSCGSEDDWTEEFYVVGSRGEWHMRARLEWQNPADEIPAE